MKAASVHEIKKVLEDLGADDLLKLCLRLVRYKKDNKELITYLLFEADHEAGFVESMKGEMEQQFSQLPVSNVYFFKKSLRKTLRGVNKQIRYSGIPQTELELRVHFCTLLKNSNIRLDKSPVLLNLYQQQLKRIQATLKKLPEDLQFDYQAAIKQLE